MVEDAALQGGKRGIAAVARPRHVDRKIKRNAAFLDDEDTVGERHCLADIMRDEKGGKAAAPPDLLDENLHIDSGQRVERTKRFVEGKKARPANKGSREGNTLALAARKSRWPLACLVRKPNPIERVLRQGEPLSSCTRPVELSITHILALQFRLRVRYRSGATAHAR